MPGDDSRKRGVKCNVSITRDASRCESKGGVGLCARNAVSHDGLCMWPAT